MISNDTFSKIKNTVFPLLGFTYDGYIETIEHEGIFVSFENGKAVIGAADKTSAARGLMLMAKNIFEGKKSFTIMEKPCFSSCGIMLDMSRGGVMKVEAVKKYISYMAALGMNFLMLYTEDVYELEDYPFFGYRRGRYTVEELMEIDRFADSLGVEVVPCIQTLGHLEKYFRWSEADPVKDTDSVILCGEEKSYELIDAMIKTMRKAFRSGRIHVGMDEAFGVGMGNYFKKHGAADKYDMINRHLARVTEICKKYDFRPMMWSDMFFRFGSETDEYYDRNNSVPEEKIAEIPDVDLVYYDYYHTDEEDYSALIKAHQKLGKKILFGGGIWTWCGLLPNIEFTFQSMIPAMKQCCEKGITDVYATMWGDDGTDTNHFLGLAGLPVFSEYCYHGRDCSLEHIKDMVTFVTGYDYDEMAAVSQFHYPFTKDCTWEGLIHPNYMGKKIFYSDPMYNMTGRSDLSDIQKRYEEALEVVRQQKNRHPMLMEYVQMVLRISIEKCEILTRLRPAYENKDMDYLEYLYEEKLQSLTEHYHELWSLHRKIWMDFYKAFGWETINARYGTMIYRLYDMKVRLGDYLIGRIDEMEELSYDFIETPHHAFRCGGMASFKDVSFTGLTI